MITFEEIVNCLEHRIEEYRKGQKAAFLLNTYLSDTRPQFSGEKDNLLQTISKQIQELKQEATQRITAVASYSQNLIDKQKCDHEEEVYQLRTQISRQYKVITLMRQELEDLMGMLNERKAEGTSQVEYQTQESAEEEEPKTQEERSQTINGLEIIEEEETDRTVISSGNSFTEEGGFTNSDNFIKIEERDREEFSEHEDMNGPPSNPQTEQREWHINHHQEDEWTSSCKFERLLESEASRRQLTYLGELHSEEVPAQWQSMPLSAQMEYGRGEPCWEGGASLKQLREITNESEKDRQTKTKMFLEEFRKTFNKCLSSGNVSRKQSKGSMSKPPKDKSKAMTATFGKVDAEQMTPSNQKLISEMLRDIDNNNKFAVGSRRSELKYEGQKKDGLRCGQGVLYYSNGLSYEGEFKNNLRHGFGVLRFNQIQIYRGEWAADELSGQGKIRNFAVINKRKSTSSSSVISRWVSYCGSFRGNRFQGEGTLYLQGGEKFLGRFICGSACGEGTLYKKSGQVETGMWRHNQLVQQF